VWIAVAPRAGAWIETGSYAASKTQAESRPAWARGLKQCLDGKSIRSTSRPRGRVDETKLTACRNAN
jgi:hypothetical protein